MQECRNRGHLQFLGRPVNPIPTRGGQIISTNYYWHPPKFSPSGRDFVCILRFRHFFLHFMSIEWTKTQKSSKMLDIYLVDFLPILYQKMKIYFLSSKKHPLASIDVMQLNVPVLKSYFGNLFWTLFYHPDHCVVLRGLIWHPFLEI